MDIGDLDEFDIEEDLRQTFDAFTTDETVQSFIFSPCKAYELCKKGIGNFDIGRWRITAVIVKGERVCFYITNLGRLNQVDHLYLKLGVPVRKYLLRMVRRRERLGLAEYPLPFEL